MRGRLRAGVAVDVREGTTPAHAGKTCRFRPPPNPHRDHPRACGEDDCPRVLCRTPAGPPPRMRGRQGALDLVRVDHRTTPAHAGKTRWLRPGGSARTDHPRACGEDLEVEGVSMLSLGPPPRMRGRPGSGANPRSGHGTTPAHAGKTPSPSQANPCTRDHPRACGEDF